jgi:hypothetical protein
VYRISVQVNPAAKEGSPYVRHISTLRFIHESEWGARLKVLLQPHEGGHEAYTRISSAGAYSTKVEIGPKSGEARALIIWRMAKPGKPVLWTLLTASGAIFPIVMSDGLGDALGLLASNPSP